MIVGILLHIGISYAYHRYTTIHKRFPFRHIHGGRIITAKLITAFEPDKIEFLRQHPANRMWRRSHVVPCTMSLQILQHHQRQQLNGVTPGQVPLSAIDRYDRAFKGRTRFKLRSHQKYELLSTLCQQSPPTCNQANEPRRSATGLHPIIKAQYIFLENPKTRFGDLQNLLYKTMRKVAQEFYTICNCISP